MFVYNFVRVYRGEDESCDDKQNDALYIQMNKLIINFVYMKKEEKSTPLSAKARSIYKYELQATN